MKKFLLAVIVIAAAVFTGCSKEEKSGSLAGTTWTGGTPGDFMETFVFGSHNNVEIHYKSWDNSGYTEWRYAGTYTYNHPKVTMVVYDWDFEEEVYYTGYIENNTMEVYGVYHGYEYYCDTYIKD